MHTCSIKIHVCVCVCVWKLKWPVIILSKHNNCMQKWDDMTYRFVSYIYLELNFYVYNFIMFQFCIIYIITEQKFQGSLMFEPLFNFL